MTDRMLMTARKLAPGIFLLCAVWLSAASAQASLQMVGINFCDSATQLTSGDTAGAPVVEQSNWNNVLSTASVGVFLNDDSGAATGANISAITSNFNSSTYGKAAVLDSIEGTPNGKLYSSSLFRKYGNDGEVTITGLAATFGVYDLYIYYGFHGDLRWNSTDTSLGRVTVADGASLNVAREFQGPALGGSNPLYDGYNFDGTFHEWFDQGLLRAGGQKVGTYSTHTVLSDLDAETLTITIGRAACFGGSEPRHGSGMTALQFVATRLPGDANLDNTVNLSDFTILKAHFGETSAVWGDGDFNDDGAVNLSDFTILKAHFGESKPAGAAVPEPSVLVLMGAAGLWLVRRRRR